MDTAKNNNNIGDNVVDILCTAPATVSFANRVRRLQLSTLVEEKVLLWHEKSRMLCRQELLDCSLSRDEEMEIAGQVLAYRHKFTACLLKSGRFRQAAITVIQNIYLFHKRHIFFGPSENVSQERIDALELFSDRGGNPALLPLDRTLNHPLIARIWQRIIANDEIADFGDPLFLELHSVVESLNTLRNVYMLFSGRLVRGVLRKVSPLYLQSLTGEDARQIGSFGVARAAYRYHHSCGVRFATYAGNWVHREFQQQALAGRLVRISSNVVENYSRQNRLAENGQGRGQEVAEPILSEAIPVPDEEFIKLQPENRPGEDSVSNPDKVVENRQLVELALSALDEKLSERSADILRRRFGLVPYGDGAQSVVHIAEELGVTRGRIYQLEQEALQRLQKMMQAADTPCIAS